MPVQTRLAARSECPQGSCRCCLRRPGCPIGRRGSGGRRRPPELVAASGAAAWVAWSEWCGSATTRRDGRRSVNAVGFVLWCDACWVRRAGLGRFYAILSGWLSTRSLMRRSAIAPWSRSDGPEVSRLGHSGSPCATSLYSTPKDAGGCLVQKMESGTAESGNAGCKPTHHEGLSVHRAATTTWDGTASASNAASD